jgi:Zn-dependent M16 (insulinase) family peptidase
MSADHTERKELTALALITDAIAGTNDAPFKKRMLDSGLCEDASFISYDGIQENALMIEIKNVREEDIPKAEKLALDTIADIVRTGIDREALVAAFNSMEFREREQDGAGMPTGISYAITAMDLWLYDADPMISLSFEDEFKYLRAALDTDYYEKLLSRVILESDHSATLYMIPDPKLGEERREKEMKKLAAAKAAMSAEEMERVKSANEVLVAWQSEDDSEEALATLPHLTVEDISDRPEPIPNEIYTLSGIPALYTNAATRGITYTNLLFDITDFTADELFLASLLTDLFKNLATDSTDAVALQTKIKTNLGAFNTSILGIARDGQPRVYMQVAVSALDSNLSSVMPITEEVLLRTSFKDKDSIGKIVKQLRTATADSISSSGHGVAFARCTAYTSAESAVLEYTDGIEFYLMLKSLDRDFAGRYDSLAKSLAAVRDKIFTRSRLTVCHAGQRRDEYVEKLASIFPEGSAAAACSPIQPIGARREGVLIPAAVSYLGYGANVLRYCDKMHGSFGVIRTLLSYGYLWGEIRVQGGAYGAGFIRRANGNAGIYTYRDPDAKRSVEKAKGSSEYLRAVAESGEDLTTYIIGAVGDSDTLLSPKVLNALSISTYLRGESYEDRLAARREMIATSSADLLNAADLIEKMLAENCYTVVGGKDKLDAFGNELTAIIEI